MLSNLGQNFLISGKIPPRWGNAHPNVVPYQAFPTVDGHVIIAIGNDHQFRKFCEVAGQPGLANDQRFVTNTHRVNNRAAIVVEIASIVAEKTTQQWLDLLGPLGVPCGPINNMAQTFQHPQVLHRHMQINMEHPASGSVPIIANPIRFTEQPIEYNRAPPLLGQHTSEVLEDILGLTPNAIDGLRRNGTI